MLTAWTDSKCLLYWLQSINLDKKQRFIYNCDKTIKDLEIKFRYVPSEDSPTDIGSRRCTPNESKNNDHWWSGPDWLNRPSSK